MFYSGIEILKRIGVPRADVTQDNRLNSTARMAVGLILGDTILSITSLAVGILGLVGVLPGLPPAALYTCLGVSGLITLSWMAMAIKSKGAIFAIANLLLASVSSNPRQYFR